MEIRALGNLNLVLASPMLQIALEITCSLWVFQSMGKMVIITASIGKNVNVFLDIAKGNTGYFSGNGKALAADMVRKGYAISTDDGPFVNMPVSTKEQHSALKNILLTRLPKLQMKLKN